MQEKLHAYISFTLSLYNSREKEKYTNRVNSYRFLRNVYYLFILSTIIIIILLLNCCCVYNSLVMHFKMGQAILAIAYRNTQNYL